MNQNNDPAIKHKLGLLELADQLRNVSRAFKQWESQGKHFTDLKPMWRKRVMYLQSRSWLPWKRRKKMIWPAVRLKQPILATLAHKTRSLWGRLKGVGRVYQQTFVDTYSKIAHCKLYTTKTPITAADLLNDRVLPFFAEHDIPLLRILTDRGTEYCGKLDSYDYELYLAACDIEHTKTKARHPQTNGICERFHKTILNEFYQITFRKKVYTDLTELQKDLDVWIDEYNNKRTHQGKMCCG